MMRRLFRKTALVFVGFVALLIVTAYLYLNWLDAHVPEHDISAYTSITSYKLLQKQVTRGYWYGIFSISSHDGSTLLQRYPFQQGFSRSRLGGRIYEAPFTDCPSCTYFIDSAGRGPYGYVLYILSADKQRLYLHQEFAD